MGPWWMTVNKLEASLRDLCEEVHSTNVAHPQLTEASAISRAEAAIVRASNCLRRLGPPRPYLADDTLRVASLEVVRAEEAVRQARLLAAMVSPRRNDADVSPRP